MTETVAKEKKVPEKKPNLMFDRYRTDADREIDGFWYVPAKLRGEEDPPAFKLARFGGTSNKKFQREYEKLSRSDRVAIDNRTMSNKQAREINLLLFIRASLVDWRHVVDESGKNLPLSEASARLLFEDDTMSGLLQELVDAASDQEQFVAASVETDSGN